MKTLYRYHMDCGRMGNVTGLFVADSVKVKTAIGRQVYFGEILGKHSEIYGTLEAGEIEALTTDRDFIEKAEKLKVVPSGYNPLDYLEEND